jgi:hypothetical protein
LCRLLGEDMPSALILIEIALIVEAARILYPVEDREMFMKLRKPRKAKVRNLL